jgi:hypothetical protein
MSVTFMITAQVSVNPLDYSTLGEALGDVGARATEIARPYGGRLVDIEVLKKEYQGQTVVGQIIVHIEASGVLS